jgi:hypothetical protein
MSTPPEAADRARGVFPRVDRARPVAPGGIYHPWEDS